MKEFNGFTYTVNRNQRHQVHTERIKLDDQGNVTDNVFFTREYEQAIISVKRIIELQENRDGGHKEGHVVYPSTLNSCEKTARCERNNMVLFTGHRGSGKSSAIMSFGQFLDHNTLEGRSFMCLPLIDPSYFDNSNNILKTVLSKLFKMAKCVRERSNDGNDSNYNDLWRSFENAYRIIGNIEGNQQNGFSLETLNELGDASNLQKVMQVLVDKFKQILPNKPDYLVLIIDDLDMNVSHAAKMLEQLRKFMMLDNLIILIAANLEQLQNELKEAYSSGFQHTKKDANQTLEIDVEDLATRYLLKVFPASRRIYVYNAADRLADTKLNIIDNGETETTANKFFKKYNGGKLQSVILTLIWERTRLLFVPKEKSLLHPIIPKNLRDLTQFVNFLLDMKEVKCDCRKGMLFVDSENYDLCHQNLIKFKNYIKNNWIPENLSYEEEKLFETIPQDVSEVNKHLINAINVIGTKNKKRLMSREVDLEQIAKNAEGVNIDRDIYTMVSPNDPRFVKANKISDIFNQPSNYSYGDLLLMIDKYETYFESEDDRRFINAVKIYYTILLFETMFYNSTEVKYSKDDIDKVRVDTIIPIQRLLGGTVYYPNYFEIITSEYFKQKGPSFDAKRAFYHKFTFENDINEVKKNNDVSVRKNKIAEIKKRQEELLFFILYYGDVRPDRYDQKHTYDTTHYNDAPIEGVKYATFDMLSLFNNALNPLQTALRANDVIYIKGDLDGSPIDGIDTINTRKRFFTKISKWSEVCSIGQERNFPNSILPFYSVDTMIQYLRRSFEDSEIIGRTEFVKKMLSRKERDYEIRKKIDYRNYIDKENNEELVRLLKEYDFDIEQIVMDELAANKKIIRKPRDLYNRIMLVDTEKTMMTLEDYSNYVIDHVINQGNTKNEKEKKEIIKQIHNCQSIAEVFDYLAKAFWNDVINEKVIKKDVQKKIRSKTSIHNYYNKLWDLTKDAFGRIKIENEENRSSNNSGVEGVYESIFNQGVKVFIEE